MAFLPLSPDASSWRSASLKSLVVMPSAASSFLNALDGSENCARMLAKLVPERLASMPASASLPMMAVVSSSVRPTVWAMGAA